MKVLIVVDMQKDFVDGALGSPAAQAIVPAVVEKIKEYVKNGYKVIFTRDTHSDNYMKTLEGKKLPVPHCIEGTEGWEIIDEIKKVVDGYDDAEYFDFINKITFGYLPEENSWREILYSGDEVEIIGLCTDICVVSNAIIIRATYPNMEITVDSKCCAGTSEENHNAALTTMRSCQIDVV